MTNSDRRFGDQESFLAKIKTFFSRGFVQSIAGVLLTAFVLWISGIWANLPTTYAQRAEVMRLEQKMLDDYKDLEFRKLNKSDYEKEHSLLREEMKEEFRKLSAADEKNLDLLMKIYLSQQKQYKKQDAEK